MNPSTFGGFAGIVFDAYGTLFDVSAIERACAVVCDRPAAFSQLWRSKQLDYAVWRTVMDRYADWGQITSDAFDYTATTFAVELAPTARRDLMRAWLELPAFADVGPALARLDAASQRMLILSNGTRHMLEPLVERNGLAPSLVDILTSERVQAFKPDPTIYAQAFERFQARPNELLFVTANGFDVAGAKSAGLTVCRVNRFGLPLDPLGFEPDIVVQDLLELADRLLGDATGG